MSSAFGRYLRARRSELGLTRQRVADQSGLSYAYLAQLESGAKSSPSLSALEQLAQGMGVPLAELAERAAVPLPPPTARTAARTSSPDALSAALHWHENPDHVRHQAAGASDERGSAPASRPRRGRSTGSELAAARAQVLPALERLLAGYAPTTRLALLNELQAQALADLGVPR